MRRSARPPMISMTKFWAQVAVDLLLDPSNLYLNVAVCCFEEARRWAAIEYDL